MKIIINKKEKTELLVTCLQYFNQSLEMWEYRWDCSNKDYKKAKEKLNKIEQRKSICIEDVFTEMILNGGGIILVDEQDSGNVRIFNKTLFNENLKKCSPTDIILLLSEDGNYDFTTTDNILQTLVFGEIIFG
jgi:hypothetical protein